MRGIEVTLNAANMVVGGSRGCRKMENTFVTAGKRLVQVRGQRSDWRFTTPIERAAFICAHQQGAPNKAASESRYIFISKMFRFTHGEIGPWKPNFGKNILN